MKLECESIWKVIRIWETESVPGQSPVGLWLIELNGLLMSLEQNLIPNHQGPQSASSQYVLLARSSTSMVSWVSHDLFSLKSYWSSYRRSCLSMCLTKCEAIICSRTLQRITWRRLVGNLPLMSCLLFWWLGQPELCTSLKGECTTDLSI